MIDSEFHNSKIFQDHLCKIKTPCKWAGLKISKVKVFDKYRTAHCNSNSKATGLLEQTFGLLFPKVQFGTVPEGFPSSSDRKESACNAGDTSLIPASGRSPAEGNGYPLQYYCLENSMDRGAWRATVPGTAKRQTRLVTNTFTLTVSKLMQFLSHSDFRFCLL